MSPLDVIAAGELYIDFVMSGFPRWPQPGEEMFAEKFAREVGGGAAITACGLARLGARSAVFGITGDDPWFAQRLQSFGVDTSRLCVESEEPTGLTVSVSDPRDRAFFSYRGANRHLASRFETANFSGARHVHLAFPIHPATPLKPGFTYSLDVGWNEDWLSDPQAFEFLRRLDVFFPNEREAARMTGEQDPSKMLETFLRSGVQRVALKLGADGAALLWDGEVHFEPAHPASVVDTTGAGDSFDAAFLHAWLAGERPVECLRAAAEFGARSTESLGGVCGK